jgi:hypothetical protein
MYIESSVCAYYILDAMEIMYLLGLEGLKIVGCTRSLHISQAPADIEEIVPFVGTCILRKIS